MPWQVHPQALQLITGRVLHLYCAHHAFAFGSLFAFPQGGHDGHCAAGVPAPLDEGVWPVPG